jgi:ribonuclease PH
MGKSKTEFKPSRAKDQMREISVELDFTNNALASVLYRQGETVVLACATKESRLPSWFPRDATKGWVNSEYSLLPGSTNSRFRRERRGPKGRTAEIERLVARSLRGSIDLQQLGPLALNVDCDILNADGGTRCASITAAAIAMRLAVRRLIASGDCLPEDLRPTFEERKAGWTPPQLTPEQQAAHEAMVIPNDVSALSVGLIDGETYLDLDYLLDSNADVDLNIVMLNDGTLVEVQGTGEESTFTREQLNSMIDMAEIGLAQIQKFQQSTLDSIE